MKYNRDEEMRDMIIFGEHNPELYLGGIRFYRGLTLKQLVKLIGNGFTDLKYRRNNCPTIGKILKFMFKYPDYTAYGFVISIKRNDYRVAIEGIEKHGAADSVEEIRDFKKLFQFAAALETDGRMYCNYA